MNWKKRYESNPDEIEVGDIVKDNVDGDFGIVISITKHIDNPAYDEIYCEWADTVDDLEVGEYNFIDGIKREFLSVCIKKVDREIGR